MKEWTSTFNGRNTKDYARKVFIMAIFLVA